MTKLEAPETAGPDQIAECRRQIDIIRLRLETGDYLSPTAAYQRKLRALKQWLAKATG